MEAEMTNYYIHEQGTNDILQRKAWWHFIHNYRVRKQQARFKRQRRAINAWVKTFSLKGFE